MEFEHTPLTKIHSWSEVPHGMPLFESIVVFENYPSSPEDTNLIREMEAFEKTNLPLALAAQLQDRALSFVLAFDQQQYSKRTVEGLGAHLSTLFDILVSATADTCIDEILQITEEVKKKALKSALLNAPTEKSAERTSIEAVEERVDEEGYSPPTNATEEVLCKIWANLYAIIPSYNCLTMV